MCRKMALIVHLWQTLFFGLASSFVIERFLLAGCGLCSPFSVPKRGSVADLERVVLRSMVVATRKAKMQKGSCSVEQSGSAALQKNRTLYLTITVHQKVKIAV